MVISRTAGLSKQCQQVYQILRAGGSITTLEAMHLDPPICRLSERCRELSIYLRIPELHKVREHKNGKTYTRYSLPQEKLKQVQQSFEMPEYSRNQWPTLIKANP